MEHLRKSRGGSGRLKNAGRMNVEAARETLGSEKRSVTSGDFETTEMGKLAQKQQWRESADEEEKEEEGNDGHRQRAQSACETILKTEPDALVASCGTSALC